MMKQDSGYYYQGDSNNGKLFYTVIEDGFEIYVGENAKYPSFRQREPFIPNPDISYEENAKNYCQSLSHKPDMIDKEQADAIYASAEDVTSLRSDIDYLMLLNDPDSAAEDTI